MEDAQEDILFQYANECNLEIHCTPFGLSGLYIKVKGTNIMGIGSTMGLITGSTKGLIHYNDSQDLMDQKYKLYVVVEEDGILRIDFTKISPLNQTNDDVTSPHRYKDVARDSNKSGYVKDNLGYNTSQQNLQKPQGIPDKSPNSISTNDNSSYASSDKSPQNANSDKVDTEGEIIEEEELPSLIFRGKCPDGRPDNVEPFIGIFSFERED